MISSTIIIDILGFTGVLLVQFRQSKQFKIQLAATTADIEKKFDLQKRHEYVKSCLPLLMEIVKDINTLREAFLNRGMHCPSIEHRSPTLSDKDGHNLELSYAQRGYQFRLIGLRVIENCRRFISLTPNYYLKETLKTCKSLKNFLILEEKGKKSYFDYIITCLTSHLGQTVILEATTNEFDQFVDKLQIFSLELEKNIEAELPYLTEVRD